MFGCKPSTSVGASSTLRGNLACGDDDLVIAGVVEGTIESDATVTVLEEGVVMGDITAHTVVVGGRIEGTVVARERLAMRPTGRIQGDARYGSLEVERGGVIEGHASALHTTTTTISERQGPLLEGAKISPVEETMRFTTPLAEVVESDADLKAPGITAPQRGGSPPGPRSTDPWGALESTEAHDSEPAPSSADG